MLFRKPVESKYVSTQKKGGVKTICSITIKKSGGEDPLRATSPEQLFRIKQRVESIKGVYAELEKKDYGKNVYYHLTIDVRTIDDTEGAVSGEVIKIWYNSLRFR